MKESTLDLPPLLLVCCCEREGGVPSCGTKGREVFLAHLAALEKLRDHEIHVLATSCIGHCALGGVVVCHPLSKKIWIDVTPLDATQIILEVRNSLETSS